MVIQVKTMNDYTSDKTRYNGNTNGKRKMTYENGDVYEGEWNNDKKNGKGKMTYNGNNYENNYIDVNKLFSFFYNIADRLKKERI